MQTFKHEELDEETLLDLLEEITELYEASEQILIELELKPQDKELQRSLFRSIHTIKGDLGMVSFTPIIPLLQHVEDLLDFLRKGQISYTSTMSDLVLLTMDRVKLFVQCCSQDGEAEYDPQLFDLFVRQIKTIHPDNSADHDDLLNGAVLLLSPNLSHGSNTSDLDIPDRSSMPSATIASTGIPKDISVNNRIDIIFFRELMKPIEKRSKFWEGRSDRIANLASYLNKLAGSPIDEQQLAVACYMHDFGMAFMPINIIYKKAQLDDEEFNLLRSHVHQSARLLEHLSLWAEARTIVMQHHERMNGKGYPLGLKGPDICEGAKLLAILDTFDALTHARAHAPNQKHPKKRAVIEINRIAEGQFCPNWMQTFNRGMASLLLK